MPPPTSLRDARTVALTTFGPTGDPEAVPVRVAREGDELLALLEAGSGAVERLRRDPRVELRPCDASGAVAPGAVVVRGAAQVLDDPGPALRALTARHPVELPVAEGVARLAGLLRRRPLPPRVTVRVRVGL